MIGIRPDFSGISGDPIALPPCFATILVRWGQYGLYPPCFATILEQGGIKSMELHWFSGTDFMLILWNWFPPTDSKSATRKTSMLLCDPRPSQSCIRGIHCSEKNIIFFLATTGTMNFVFFWKTNSKMELAKHSKDDVLLRGFGWS